MPEESTHDDQEADRSDHEGLSNAEAAQKEQERQERTGEESPA